VIRSVGDAADMYTEGFCFVLRKLPLADRFEAPAPRVGPAEAAHAHHFAGKRDRDFAGSPSDGARPP
jgi:hypothetical protein